MNDYVEYLKLWEPTKEEWQEIIIYSLYEQNKLIKKENEELIKEIERVKKGEKKNER